MEANGYAQCCPRPYDPDMEREPFIDFTSGYIRRAVDAFPKQGIKVPWRAYQNYLLDTWTVAYGSLTDDALEFTRRPLGRHQDATTDATALPEQAAG